MVCNLSFIHISTEFSTVIHTGDALVSQCISFEDMREAQIKCIDVYVL